MFPTSLTVHEGAALPQETVLDILRRHGAEDVIHGSVSAILEYDYIIARSQAEALAKFPGLVGDSGEETAIRLLGDETIPATPIDIRLTMVPIAGLDWFVVPDEVWAELPGEQYSADFYDWPDAGRNALISADIEELLGADGLFRYTSDRYSQYQSMMQLLSLSMFAGLFVSLLFFIGSGSLIYFKLFTELPDDARMFGRLRRIGVTTRETRKIVTTQIAIVFLLPFAAGSIHALVALDALGTLLMTDVTGYSLIVIGLFAVVQFGFFLLTRWTYLRALIPNGAVRLGPVGT